MKVEPNGKVTGIDGYVPTTHHSGGGTNLPIKRIVIHDMEWPERPGVARDCAHYFATTNRQASAHFCVDNREIIQCVTCTARAWHAPPNSGSIGIELAGYANQTAAQWSDEYSRAELQLTARLVSVLCDAYQIPRRKITPMQIEHGVKGICGHIDITNAWHQTDHTDPGRNFPWGTFMKMVNGTITTEEDDMPLTKADAALIADAIYTRFTMTSPDGKELNLQAYLEALLQAVSAR